jgi:DnaJ-class molecular chaperone
MADRETCPNCSGRGWVPFATEEVQCAVCDGKGTVTPKVAKAENEARSSA